MGWRCRCVLSEKCHCGRGVNTSGWILEIWWIALARVHSLEIGSRFFDESHETTHETLKPRHSRIYWHSVSGFSPNGILPETGSVPK